MNSELKNKIIYLKEVLGIRSIFNIEDKGILGANLDLENSDLKKPENKFFKILFFDDQKWATEDSQMFHNIIKAMKLEPSQFQLVNLTDVKIENLRLEAFKSDVVISFCDDKSIFVSEEQIQLYSPRVLNKDPGKKREVWEVLQKFTNDANN